MQHAWYTFLFIFGESENAVHFIFKTRKPVVIFLKNFQEINITYSLKEADVRFPCSYSSQK